MVRDYLLVRLDRFHQLVPEILLGLLTLTDLLDRVFLLDLLTLLGL